MKPVLIAVNAVLAVWLLFAVVGYFKPDAPLPEPAKPAVSAQLSKPAAAERIEKPDAATIRSRIAAADLFNTASGTSGSGERSATVRLVGTFTSGELSGAILQITARSNNRMPPWGGGRGNWGGNDSANNSATEKDYSFKQYIRVGETNSSGYTLISVEPGKAVLSRNGERIELAILSPSVNAPTAAANANANNQNATRQQFSTRDALAMQMFQNMQMMRVMERMINAQQRGTRGTTSGRRSGGSSSGSGSGGFGGGFGGGGFSGGGFGGGGFGGGDSGGGGGGGSGGGGGR